MMKEKKSFFGRLFSKNPQNNFDIQLDIIQYEEDGIYFNYSPALNLVGYGKSLQEAKESWETVLEEYFRYALNKKSLQEDLEKYGWKIHKKGAYYPPSLTWLLENNDQMKETYNDHDFKKTTAPFKVPTLEACL